MTEVSSKGLYTGFNCHTTIMPCPTCNEAQGLANHFHANARQSELLPILNRCRFASVSCAATLANVAATNTVSGAPTTGALNHALSPIRCVSAAVLLITHPTKWGCSTTTRSHPTRSLGAAMFCQRSAGPHLWRVTSNTRPACPKRSRVQQTLERQRPTAAPTARPAIARRQHPPP